MTNPQTDPEVELEEGEIEDDGCEAEAESAIGKTESDVIEDSKVETKSEIQEVDVKGKGKPSNGIKPNKKSRGHKEKVLEFEGKKKYATEAKLDCWDMVYNDFDESEDDKTYHRELEEVLMRINSDKYGHSGSESVSGEEDDKLEVKKSRNSKRYEEGDEPPKFPTRYHSDKKSKITCKFFMDGNCMKGADCHYSHDKNIRLREKDICKTYKATGHCPYGKKCRYLHIDSTSKVGAKPLSSVKNTSLSKDKPFQNKKETPSRKRRPSSDKDESEQPPRKKIPSLLDLNVIPKGQSEEDVGKALMIAAKRSTSLVKSRVRKIGLLGNSPDHPKKSLEKKTRKLDDGQGMEVGRSEEVVDDKSVAQEKEDFGDKDERQIIHYNDIDERQTMSQVLVTDNSNKMEEEPFKVQPPLPQNNNINVRALLGDAPAPIINGPPRVPLLGNAPTNFNLPFPQFPRPHMRPNQPPMGLTQTLGLIMNQNIASMPHPPRMLNPGLLPHPLNPPRGLNGGFNPRPFGPGMQPNSFMGSQNLGLSQMSNSLLPVPLNIPREPPFSYASGPLTMPTQYHPEEAKVHQGDLGRMCNKPIIADDLQASEVAPSLQFSNGPYDQKISNEPAKCPPIDHSMDPVRNIDPNLPVTLKNDGNFDTFSSGFGDTRCQDKDMRGTSTSFFDNSKPASQPFFPDTPVSTASALTASLEDVGGIKKTFSGLYNASFQSDSKHEEVDKKEETGSMDVSKGLSTEVANMNITSSTHESSSISLSAANEVSFDCKLRGPYSLQKIDFDAKITLPHYINPTDPDWSSDPRVQKHKDDPIPVKKTIVMQIHGNVPVNRPLLDSGAQLAPATASTIIQTRDPRLLKRNRKEMDTNSEPASQDVIALSQATSDSNKQMETLEQFLRRYSSLPLSELNTDENSLSMETKPDQDSNGASQSENVNAAKRSYHSLIVKKSSATRLLNPVRLGGSPEVNDDDTDESKKSKRAKVALEFQSPLMSNIYSAPSPTLQYGLPPNDRFRESVPPQKPSDPAVAPQSVGGPATVPESSLFTPASNIGISSEGSVKSLFNNIDPTASPFL